MVARLGIQADRGLILAVLFLMGLGLVQVYSSSYLFAVETHHDGLFFFRKQAAFTLLSLAVFFALIRFPKRWLPVLGWLVWGLAVVGLAATLVPGLGMRAGGAARWLKLPLSLRVEPGEFLRASFPFVFAWILTAPVPTGRFLRTLLWRGALVTVPCVLMLAQPDFGGVVILMMVALTMAFAHGLSWVWLLGGLVTAGLAAVVLVLRAPYRLARVQAFLDPWADPAEKGFQLIQSMLSFHAGGVWGQGIGQGKGKLFFLPEAHTDFTLAVLAEEMGFIGVSTVLLVFGFLVFKGFQVAARQMEERPRLVALGLSLSLGLSVLVNIGVVTGLLPTKGLTLPFLSYGGSSLLANTLLVGWLLGMSQVDVQAWRGRKPRVDVERAT